MSVEPSPATRILVAEADDNSQVLLYQWPDGSIEISRRERQGDVWGPPMRIVEDVQRGDQR